MTNEVTIVEEPATPQAYRHQQMTPEETIAAASRAATALAAVIDKQKLYSMINGRKYVKVDAYIALGNIQGVYPKEVRCTEDADGTFESYVDLIDRSTGRVIGGSSAICGSDEPTWKSRPRYARRSMATTRATGKALRLHYAWILALAGYETTPSEEMDEKTEYYQENPTQKTRLKEVAIRLGVQDNATLHRLSGYCKGKPLNDLAMHVADYLALHKKEEPAPEQESPTVQ